MSSVPRGESTGAREVNSTGSTGTLCIDLQKPGSAKKVLLNQFLSLLSLGSETRLASLSHFPCSCFQRMWEIHRKDAEKILQGKAKIQWYLFEEKEENDSKFRLVCT